MIARLRNRSWRGRHELHGLVTKEHRDNDRVWYRCHRCSRTTRRW